MLDRDAVAAEVPPIQFEAGIEVDAQPEAVFALISDHRQLPSWVPGLRRVEVDESQASSPGGVGTRRKLYPIIGAAGVEVVVAFEPPHRIVYSASDESLRGLLTRHRAEISCQPSAGGTLIRWIVRGVRSRSGWKRILAKMVFRHALRGGLANLHRHFLAAGASERPGT